MNSMPSSKAHNRLSFHKLQHVCPKFRQSQGLGWEACHGKLCIVLWCWEWDVNSFRPQLFQAQVVILRDGKLQDHQPASAKSKVNFPQPATKLCEHFRTLYLISGFWW